MPNVVGVNCEVRKWGFSWLSATVEKCLCDSFLPSDVEKLSRSCGKKPLLESVTVLHMGWLEGAMLTDKILVITQKWLSAKNENWAAVAGGRAEDLHKSTEKHVLPPEICQEGEQAGYIQKVITNKKKKPNNALAWAPLGQGGARSFIETGGNIHGLLCGLLDFFLKLQTSYKLCYSTRALVVAKALPPRCSYCKHHHFVWSPGLRIAHII